MWKQKERFLYIFPFPYYTPTLVCLHTHAHMEIQILMKENEYILHTCYFWSAPKMMNIRAFISLWGNKICFWALNLEGICPLVL